VTDQEIAKQFFKSIVAMVGEAFPERCLPLDMLRLRTTNHSISPLEKEEGAADAGYDPVHHYILVTPECGGRIAFAGKNPDPSSRLFIDTFWMLTHEVMHAISHRKILKTVDADKDGELVIEIGPSVATEVFQNGVRVKRDVKLEVLNEALTNFNVRRAVKRRRPDVSPVLDDFYREIGLKQDIEIVERLISFAGENAINLAYFEGKLRPLEKGLRKASIDPAKFFDLSGSRNHPLRDERMVEAIRMIGLTPDLKLFGLG
jgi:hypothetical protein